MKTIAVLIAGIALGMTGTAVAATSYYWNEHGKTYGCEGNTTGVICKETNWKPVYKIALVPGSVIVSYRGRVIFGCERQYAPGGNCRYYGP